MIEKRKYERLKFDRHVELEFANSAYDFCHIDNLSRTGMFVKGNFKKQEDNCCLVKLVQKGGTTDLSLMAIARVVRKNDKGIALEFTSMTFESYTYLNIILLNGMGNSSIVDKIIKEDCPYELTDHMLIKPK